MVEIHWLVVDKGQSLAGLGVLEDDSFWPGRGFIPGGEDIQQSEVTAIEKPRARFARRNVWGKALREVSERST
jgi:hypothetical protein